jgi:signal transduction histidine kinase
MLELLGRLAGLHYQLQSAFKRQAQTYKVFVHQLRNPIFQAWRRAQKLRPQAEGSVAVLAADRYVDAVCGLLGKARRLVINLRLFANLEASLPVRTDQISLAPADLVRPLIELASDNRILWQHSKIAFHVDPESFNGAGNISVDMDLFEQVAGNVLDNFGKYGTPETTTTISAVIQRIGREVAISFKGRSIPVLTPEDAARAGTKGWRGVEARQLSTEGEGVGLWMTRQIMVAHNGRMDVIPTDENGYTEIRLVFPLL